MGRAKPLRPVIPEMALAHELLVAVPNSWARFEEVGPGQWMGTGKVEIRAFDHDRQLAVLEWLLDAEWLESISSTHTRTDRTLGERLLDLLERFGALDFAVPAQPPTVSSGAQGAGGFTINAHGEFTDRLGYPVEPNEVLIRSGVTITPTADGENILLRLAGLRAILRASQALSADHADTAKDILITYFGTRRR